MNDVRDILSIPDNVSAASSLNQAVSKKPQRKEPFKRPEGMHRELYNLLCADGGKNLELAPLLPTDTPGGYKKKLQLGAKKVRKWKWTPFTNPGRKDGAVFYHWRRIGEENREYPFAKFNREIPIVKYSESEYVNHLEKEGWTKEETDHLFDLARRFDLRFPIMHDRYKAEGTSFVTRSLEDIKERYYQVNAILTKLRAEPGQEPNIFNFDADHERKRKEQLDKLWKRTSEQVEEEEFLRAEMKRIEVRKKERERKTQDLQKLITAADGGGAMVVSGGDTAKRMDLKKTGGQSLKRKSSAGTKGLVLNGGEVSTSYGLKWPDFKNPGITTRSGRMKLPVGIGQKKAKIVDAKLRELGVDPHAYQNVDINVQFNELRSDIVLHYELHSILTACEAEIHSLKSQYEGHMPGETLEIPKKLQSIISLPVIKFPPEYPPLHETTVGMKASQAPYEPGAQSATISTELPSPIRKRKAALEQGNVLRRLKNKM